MSVDHHREAHDIAATMLDRMDPADAIAFLEDRLAGCIDDDEADACCVLIDAVSAAVRRCFH